jgi:hypothetical protein
VATTTNTFFKTNYKTLLKYKTQHFSKNNLILLKENGGFVAARSPPRWQHFLNFFFFHFVRIFLNFKFLKNTSKILPNQFSTLLKCSPHQVNLPDGPSAFHNPSL